ncbi:vanomycin resistance protein VanB [Lacrimispora amygdalina]|uniref:Vanomycin resistance protein VanB n=1 Tax=Lacrimispora amygdalina TaxID=253257 RepID=A0A3E2NB79_9FIRM|nr:VanW family protein [Clostridium indicum]RFZ78160.1 vanomycin resistance protein VanB [Clostridium indicum]
MSQDDNRQRSGGRTYSSQNGSKRNTPNSGRRTSQSYRGGSTYQQRRGKKRRRGPQYGITKILLAAVFAVASVISVMAAVKYIGGHKTKETDVNSTTVSETQLKKEVHVEGISITGLSRAEAKKTIDQSLGWGMKVIYQDETYELKNFLDSRIDALLEEIYSKDAKEEYTIDTDGLEDDVKAEVKAIAAKWDVPAKNGSISGFDKSTGKFVYSGEEKGIAVDQDKLTADILAQIKAKNYKASVTAQVNETAPKITEEQAKALYKVIGTYTTTTTTNSDRNKNIELASTALNGLILQPGEEFSFNKTTGERSSAKGYRPAGAYLNGVLIEEPGGGVCQVSSTLYNAVVFAGLTTTERHAHSYEPSYVTPGEDAMVSFGGPDMKFINNSSSAIAIRTSFADRKLKISIVGIPILEDGVTLSMTSQKTAELDAPAPIYEEDQTMQPGEEKVIKQETKGSRWVTNLVTKKNGTVVSDEFFHNSTYRGKPATIKRNTSGVVVPATDPSASVPENNQGNTQTTAATGNGPGVNAGETPPQAPAQETQNTAATQAETEGTTADNTQTVIQPNPMNQ